MEGFADVLIGLQPMRLMLDKRSKQYFVWHSEILVGHMSLHIRKGGELCISEKFEFEKLLEIKSEFENILELYTGK